MESSEFPTASFLWVILGIDSSQSKSFFTDRTCESCRMCLCAQAKDRNGVSIKKLKDVGSSSFRAILDTKAHQSCDLGKKGLGF